MTGPGEAVSSGAARAVHRWEISMSRAAASVAGRVAVLVAAATAVLATAGIAAPSEAVDAAAFRDTRTRITCTPKSGLSGRPISCEVEVRDRGQGDPVAPEGILDLASTPDDAQMPEGECVLAAASTDTSTCVVTLLYLSPGRRTVVATFTPTDGVHTTSSSDKVDVTMKAPATPVVYSPQKGKEGRPGEQVQVYISACSSTRGRAVWGEFVSRGADSDPLVAPDGKPIEAVVAVDGSGRMTFDIGGGGDGVWQSRWFCADASPTGPDDPAVTWVSDLYTFTVTGGGVVITD